MQVNLNTSINKTSPNFKAHFAKDNETQENLRQWIKDDPKTALAIKFALKDSSDKCSIHIEKFHPRVGVNYTGALSYRLDHNYCKSYNRPWNYIENWKALLEDICENEKDSRGFSFLENTPKNFPEYYLRKAKEFLESSMDSKLIDKQKVLNEQFLKLQKELSSVNSELKNKAVELAKKHI